MRWMLSLTAISGRPTRTVFSRPPETSTSTSTGTASIPTSANVFSLASMGDPRGAEASTLLLIMRVVFDDLRRGEIDQTFDDQPDGRNNADQGNERHVKRDDPGFDQVLTRFLFKPRSFHDVLGEDQAKDVDRDQNAEPNEAENRGNVIEE